MISIRHMISVCCIPLIFVGMYVYLSYSKEHIPHLLDPKALAKMTDSSLLEVQYRQYDKTGLLIHSMEAPLIKHIPKDNTHVLTSPHIRVIEVNKAPWDINARTATAIQGGKQITFENNVRIRQEKTDTATETVLLTDSLSYFPDEKKAKTTSEVIVTQAGSQMRSKGLIADLTDNSVRLLSNARGHYVQNAG